MSEYERRAVSAGCGAGPTMTAPEPPTWATNAPAVLLTRAGDADLKRCHWDECPHGENCVHA